MKDYFVWDNGSETNYKQDQEAAASAVREATHDGRNAYIFLK
jgi:hypothetical protein